MPSSDSNSVPSRPESAASAATPRDEGPLSSEARLRLAAAAFDRGDFRRTGQLLAGLEDAPDPAIQARVETLRNRLRPSPLAMYLYGLTFAILVLVTLFAYVR